MLHTFAIRKAKQSDREALFPMAREASMSFDVDRPSFDEMFSGLLNHDSCLLMVAEDDGGLHGYLLGFDHPTFFANGSVSWMEELFVDVASRRCGIATALVSAFERWSAERKSTLVALATRRAADFYRAIGYAESATYFVKLH